MYTLGAIFKAEKNEYKFFRFSDSKVIKKKNCVNQIQFNKNTS